MAAITPQITENQGEAELSRAREQAEQTAVVAEAQLARARRVVK